MAYDVIITSRGRILIKISGNVIFYVYNDAVKIWSPKNDPIKSYSRFLIWLTAKMTYDVIMTSRGRILIKISGKLFFSDTMTLSKFEVQTMIQSKVIHDFRFDAYRNPACTRHILLTNFP